MKLGQFILSIRQVIEQQLRQFWQARQSREKGILIIGLLFVVVVGVWFGLWQPFAQYRKQVEQQYQAFQQQLPFIIRAATIYRSFQQQHQLPQMRSTASLESQVKHMLIVQQLVPFGPKLTMLHTKQGRLEFKQIPFDQLMTGVEQLNKQAIFVIQAKIAPHKSNGLVSGQIIFSQY